MSPLFKPIFYPQLTISFCLFLPFYQIESLIILSFTQNINKMHQFRSFSGNKQDDFFENVDIIDKFDAVVPVRSANDEPKFKEEISAVTRGLLMSGGGGASGGGQGEVNIKQDSRGHSGNSETELFLQTRQTEPEFMTKNAMQYDQKFMDKVRVWAFGGKGG